MEDPEIEQAQSSMLCFRKNSEQVIKSLIIGRACYDIPSANREKPKHCQASGSV